MKPEGGLDINDHLSLRSRLFLGENLPNDQNSTDPPGS
jgi:hypothetical protein